MLHLRPALVLLILFTLLTGVVYPLGMTGLAQVIFPAQATGSLVTRDGTVIGSSLIGQNFKSDRYFQGRPSATSTTDPADASRTVDAPYNAASSTGTNLGPSSKALKETIETRAKALGAGPQPADLVTSSASGLDPHISLAGALVQLSRVAKARNLPVVELRSLVDRHIEGRHFGILGEPRVNVLALNIALDSLKP